MSPGGLALPSNTRPVRAPYNQWAAKTSGDRLGSWHSLQASSRVEPTGWKTAKDQIGPLPEQEKPRFDSVFSFHPPPKSNSPNTTTGARCSQIGGHMEFIVLVVALLQILGGILVTIAAKSAIHEILGTLSFGLGVLSVALVIVINRLTEIRNRLPQRSV